MKLTIKLNLAGLSILLLVGVGITVVGMTTIREAMYSVNNQLMAKEVETIFASFQDSYDILVENLLDGVSSYQAQAQHEMIEQLTDYRYGQTGGLMIVKADGTVLRQDPAESVLAMSTISELIAAGSGDTTMKLGEEERVFSYRYFGPWNWLILLSVSSSEMFAAQEKFVAQVLVIMLVCLAVGVLIFPLLIGRIVRPMRQLADAATLVSEGKWDVKLPEPSGGDEIAQLARSFKHMSQNLATMYGDLMRNLETVEHSQAALSKSEEKYRGLVNLLPLSVFEADRDGNLVFANQHLLDTFGFNSIPSSGLKIFELITDEDQERLTSAIKVIMEGKNAGLVDYKGKRKNGEIFPVLSLATPIHHDKDLFGIRGIFMDITERKELEDQLVQTREFLAAILNNVADPIFVKDEQHRWVLLNKEFCSFMGYEREEMLGKSDHDFFPKEQADEFWEKDRLVFSSEEPIENEEEITNSTGKRHIILTKKAVFKAAEGNKLLVGTIKDITDRKRMELELLQSQKLKSISILAGGIAHDFNNILTAIIGNLSLMKEMIDTDDNLYSRLVETERASLRAKSLTHQLLTFSHGGAPVKSMVSMSELVEESVTFTLRGTKIRSELNLAEDGWTVEVDESQMSRVVQNIVVNAVQAMPDGGTLSVSTKNLEIDEKNSLPLSKGKYLRIAIGDNGPGIKESLLANIFDPYFTTKDDGTGLGLAIAYSIVQRHGGHITVESEVNKGTSFNIYLPASNREIESKPIITQMTLEGSGDILVMDDELIVRDTVSAMLQYLGYQVESAADGQEALQLYRDRMEVGRPFDAVIIDLTIPGGMGGQEMVEELLAFDPKARALVSSGYSQDPVMANFSKYGFSGVIAKPFEINKIALTLKEVLAAPIARPENTT